MDWIQVTIYTNEAGLEVVSAQLDSICIDQVELIESEAMIQAVLEETHLDWDLVEPSALQQGDGRCAVRCYLVDDVEGRDKLREINRVFEALMATDIGLDIGAVEIETAVMADEDWSKTWKKYYKPFNVGRRLWVKPFWEEAEVPEGRIMVEMEPGLAFGTGSHETTSLCMELLEESVEPGMEVYDIGCGTGILAITALKLGAKSALAVDRDPNCITATRNNAEYNHIGPELTIAQGNLMDGIEKPVELIVANIFAEIILLMVEDAFRCLKVGGTLIVSGIIDAKQAMVEKGLKDAGFVVEKVLQKADWVAIRATRPEV